MRLHGVIACARLVLVACLLLFLLADKVFPINPETRTTWKFECDSVLWLPPAAAAEAAWNRLTATSGLFKIESPQVSPTFWHCWKLKWFCCSYFVWVCIYFIYQLFLFFFDFSVDTSGCLLTYYQHDLWYMLYRFMKLTWLPSLIIRFDVPRFQLPFSQYFVVSPWNWFYLTSTRSQCV